MCRYLILLAVLAPATNAQPIQMQTFGGSGNDVAFSVTTDAQGSVYLAGTTTSFDLPVVNAAQSVNRGTELIVSRDSGITWQPLGNLPPSKVSSPSPAPLIAASPLDPQFVFAARETTVYRSSNGGRTFTGTPLPLALGESISVISATPDVVYVGTIGLHRPASDFGSLYRSYDNGLSWTQPVSLGAPVASLAFDPFHANTIWAWAGSGGMVSKDGGTTWTPSSLQAPAGGNSFGGFRFVFDAATPGVIYGPSFSTGVVQFVGVSKSTDNGATWRALDVPFANEQIFADPVRGGYLYAIGTGISDGRGGINPMVFRSRDGGATWTFLKYPGTFASSLTIDPAHPDTLLVGSDRSTDGGDTWTVIAPSRPITAVFGPAGSGIVYASAATTSDGFFVKYAADGRTPLLASYFGGMGNETIASIKVDPADNIWIFGTTTSTDLPVTQDAYSWSGDLFLARFDWTGALRFCTYLTVSGNDTASAMALGPDGSVWLAGRGYVMRIGPSGTPEVVANLPVTTVPAAIAVDPFGSAIVTGGTLDGNPPYVFVFKYHAAGDLVFQEYLGGTIGAKTQSTNYGYQQGTGVDTDAAGNIYITGSTSMTDFPVTTGATVHAGCTYPALATNTGMIGTLYFYLVNDVFVIKLSPDGNTILYSTLLGGSCYDRATSIAVTPEGLALVAGETDSQDFPQANSSGTPPDMPQYKSFAAVIDTNRSTLDYSSYLFAGSTPAVAFSPNGNLHVAGAQGNLAQTQQYTSPYTGIPIPANHAVLFNIPTPQN